MARTSHLHQPSMRHAAAAVVIVCATLAGCTSSSDDGASEGTATVETTGLSPGSVGASLADAGLDCNDVKLKGIEAPPTTEAPTPITEAALCTVNGFEVTITVFATADDAQLARDQMDSHRSQLASLGYTQLAWSVSGPDDRVWVQVESDDFTPSPTEENMTVLEDIASALGGAVVTFDI